MKQKRLYAIITLFTIFLAQNALCEDFSWETEGEKSLSGNLTVPDDKSFPEQEGSLTIEGNNFSIDGNRHIGYTDDNSNGYDLTVRNVGKFLIQDTDLSSDNTITLYINGEKVLKNIDIQSEGFHNFSFNETTSGGGAWAPAVLYNEGNTTIENSVFTDNSSDFNQDGRSGGAVLWQDKWDDEDSSQTGLIVKNSLFKNNYVKSDEENLGGCEYEVEVEGGALAVEGSQDDTYYGNQVHIDNSYFIENHAEGNGAIYANGGAVSIAATYVTEINDSYFGKNYVKGINAQGGGLFIDNLDVNYEFANITNSVFEKNYVEGKYGAYGGAVDSYHSLKVDNSLFEGNYALGYAVKAGALYAHSSYINPEGVDYYDGQYYLYEFEIANSLFENNYVKKRERQGFFGGVEEGDESYILDDVSGGGAIYNELESTLTIKDSTFKNNKAIGEGLDGGAIFNAKDADLTIIAQDNNVLFEGNQAGADESNLKSNAISDHGGTINLNANEGKQIIFNDSINSYDNAQGQMNINKDDPSYKGEIVLNADMTGYVGNVDMYGGTITLGNSDSATLFEGANAFTIKGVSNLNLINGSTKTVNLGNLVLESDLNLFLDVNFDTNEIDKIEANSVQSQNSAKLKVDGFNLLGGETKEHLQMSFSENEEVMDVIELSENGKEALGKIFVYDVTYNDEDGSLEFNRAGKVDDKPQGGGDKPTKPDDNPQQGGDNKPSGGSGGNPSYTSFNPAVLSSVVAVQAGAIATMNHAFHYAMQNSDNMMTFPKFRRLAFKDNNKYAANISDYEFSPVFTKQIHNGFWTKPYTTIESIPLKNGPKVNNISYGTFFGYDSKLTPIKKGFSRTLTLYAGYNGASQRFQGVNTTLNGGILGGTVTLYKGNFFNATTLNAGSIVGDSRNMYGSENYTMLLAGVANKFGYNFESKEGAFIFQPSVLLAYSFINNFDYTNSSGVKINSDPVNVLQVSPGVKLIHNSKTGWQPYLSANMVWNFINNSDTTANGVILPQMTIKPYVQYGIGLQKICKDYFMFYAQALMQNGGRNGVALSAGLRWSIGRDKNKINRKRIKSNLTYKNDKLISKVIF